MQVEIFEFTSVTVNVTVFDPTFAHVNAETSRVEEAIPHASVAEAVTSAGIIDTFPVASN